jgi:hypothetical protein
VEEGLGRRIVIGYKFLAAGARAPFTRFQWPLPGGWVRAPADRADLWIHACRRRDLPYWLDDELWRIELEEPVREARYQIASPRARLLSRVAAWDRAFGQAYARACALRVRELAVPHVPPAIRDAIAEEDDLEALAAAAGRAGPDSRAAGYVADAAVNARLIGPSTTSYIAAMLASSLGGGLAAFEAERAWQARWLAERLALERDARSDS